MLRITDETRTKPIYVALYLFPLLSLIHAVMAGLVCKYMIMCFYFLNSEVCEMCAKLTNKS